MYGRWGQLPFVLQMHVRNAAAAMAAVVLQYEVWVSQGFGTFLVCWFDESIHAAGEQQRGLRNGTGRK
jgi:hypothetical protein